MISSSDIVFGFGVPSYSTSVDSVEGGEGVKTGDKGGGVSGKGDNSSGSFVPPFKVVNSGSFICGAEIYPRLAENWVASHDT
jgi:hypothetical protein